MIDKADTLIIIGYGINSDDEHITTLLQGRLCQGKKIKIFIYSENPDDDDWKNGKKIISKQFQNSENIEWHHTSEFNEVISTL